MKFEITLKVIYHHLISLVGHPKNRKHSSIWTTVLYNTIKYLIKHLIAIQNTFCLFPEVPLFLLLHSQANYEDWSFCVYCSNPMPLRSLWRTGWATSSSLAPGQRGTHHNEFPPPKLIMVMFHTPIIRKKKWKGAKNSWKFWLHPTTATVLWSSVKNSHFLESW